ncbi:hypothetical protein [Fusobacterium sp.]|uniref:hypothetical protein n=1 Tax=Fusobacterium sp. TaxID=68766 RepID=UPI00396C65FF
MENDFWKEWFKFVIMLIGILIVWVGIIFICDKFFNRPFEELKYIHYFIFFALIMKAKNIFLKKIKNHEEDDKK